MYVCVYIYIYVYKYYCRAFAICARVTSCFVRLSLTVGPKSPLRLQLFDLTVPQCFVTAAVQVLLVYTYTYIHTFRQNYIHRYICTYVCTVCMHCRLLIVDVQPVQTCEARPSRTLALQNLLILSFVGLCFTI